MPRLTASPWRLGVRAALLRLMTLYRLKNIGWFLSVAGVRWWCGSAGGGPATWWWWPAVRVVVVLPLGGSLCGEAGERLGQGRRRRRRAGCSAKAGTLRASEIPAGPVRPRAWYVPAIASGQLPSLTVEVGPSRVPTVLLP